MKLHNKDLYCPPPRHNNYELNANSISIPTPPPNNPGLLNEKRRENAIGLDISTVLQEMLYNITVNSNGNSNFTNIDYSNIYKMETIKTRNASGLPGRPGIQHPDESPQDRDARLGREAEEAGEPSNITLSYTPSSTANSTYHIYLSPTDLNIFNDSHSNDVITQKKYFMKYNDMAEKEPAGIYLLATNDISPKKYTCIGNTIESKKKCPNVYNTFKINDERHKFLIIMLYCGENKEYENFNEIDITPVNEEQEDVLGINTEPSEARYGPIYDWYRKKCAVFENGNSYEDPRNTARDPIIIINPRNQLIIYGSKDTNDFSEYTKYIYSYNDNGDGEYTLNKVQSNASGKVDFDFTFYSNKVTGESETVTDLSTIFDVSDYWRMNDQGQYIDEEPFIDSLYDSNDPKNFPTTSESGITLERCGDECPSDPFDGDTPETITLTLGTPGEGSDITPNTITLHKKHIDNIDNLLYTKTVGNETVNNSVLHLDNEAQGTYNKYNYMNTLEYMCTTEPDNPCDSEEYDFTCSEKDIVYLRLMTTMNDYYDRLNNNYRLVNRYLRHPIPYLGRDKSDEFENINSWSSLWYNIKRNNLNFYSDSIDTKQSKCGTTTAGSYEDPNYFLFHKSIFDEELWKSMLENNEIKKYPAWIPTSYSKLLPHEGDFWTMIKDYEYILIYFAIEGPADNRNMSTKVFISKDSSFDEYVVFTPKYVEETITDDDVKSEIIIKDSSSGPQAYSKNPEPDIYTGIDETNNGNWNIPWHVVNEINVDEQNEGITQNLCNNTNLFNVFLPCINIQGLVEQGSNTPASNPLEPHTPASNPQQEGSESVTETSCRSNFTDGELNDNYRLIDGVDISNYDLMSLISSPLSGINCSETSGSNISCSGNINVSGTLNCSETSSGSGIISCSESGLFLLSGCNSSNSENNNSQTNTENATCAQSGSGICDEFEDFNSSGNCSGAICTKEECCDMSSNLLLIGGILCIVCCIIILIIIALII